MTTKTPLIIEQHIHGAFGIDFNTASVDDVLKVADGLLKLGIGGFFPTLVTDSVSNIKNQISIIKEASKFCPRILGVHLEGIFINPEKKGIHNPEHFLALTVENYKLIEDDFIKIITIAPELDEGLISYLSKKDIKIQAGHCTGYDFTNINGVTHTFNAMSGINHRENSTALQALVNDNVYTEIIADGVHVNNEALKLLFKSKPIDKIILISDALPITNSNLTSINFAGSEIFYNGEKATSKDGTIAGSTSLLPIIIKRLNELNLFDTQLILNPYVYHNITPQGTIEWDDEWNIIKITT